MTTPRDRIEKFVTAVESGEYPAELLLSDLKALLDATKPKEPKPNTKPARALRLVPHFGDTISPADIAEALGITTMAAGQTMARLHKQGLVVRIRMGQYSLPKAAP